MDSYKISTIDGLWVDLEIFLLLLMVAILAYSFLSVLQAAVSQGCLKLFQSDLVVYCCWKNSIVIQIICIENMQIYISQIYITNRDIRDIKHKQQAYSQNNIMKETDQIRKCGLR